jgi:archaellum component FlaC
MLDMVTVLTSAKFTFLSDKSEHTISRAIQTVRVQVYGSKIIYSQIVKSKNGMGGG